MMEVGIRKEGGDSNVGLVLIKIHLATMVKEAVNDGKESGKREKRLQRKGVKTIDKCGV